MHSGKIKALFIVNEILEKKSGQNIARLVSEHLDLERFDPTVLYSEYPGHAGELANRYVGQYRLMVAGGGDGTVNQVACNLVHTETVLGILPLGSGKGLARSLKIPLNVRRALGIINSFQISRIDTGMADAHRFVNITGIGFAAEVAHDYATSIKRGFFPYASHTIKKLPGYSPVPAGIQIGDRIISGRYFDVSIANSSQWGYGARISPTSKPGDGILELCLFDHFPLLRAPGLLARLFTGTIHRSKYMEVIPVSSVRITGEGPFTGHIDGEPVEFPSPLEISIEPGSLQVVRPERV
jgi:diacylglycerol kinase (ATP)